MEKITKLKTSFDWGLLGRHAFTFVFMMALSIGVQALVFRFSTFMLPSLIYLGILADTALGAILILPLITRAIHGEFVGSRYLLVSLFALIGVYICVAWYMNWFVLIACLLVLLYNLPKLSNLGFSPYVIYTYLFYCIGAYVAMLINDWTPATDIYGFITISWLTFLLWFTSASHDCLKH